MSSSTPILRRQDHVTESLGPISCSECETLVANKYCLQCDEYFCPSCHPTIHQKGKRRTHHFYTPISDQSGKPIEDKFLKEVVYKNMNGEQWQGREDQLIYAQPQTS